MKYITFELQNGSIYGLPLELVAKKRAEHYAAKDPDTTFESEMEYVMGDNYEGLDWFMNNQNPSDFDADDYRQLKAAPDLNIFQKIDLAARVTIEEIE